MRAKKKTSRIISLILAIALALGMSATAFAEGDPPQAQGTDPAFDLVTVKAVGKTISTDGMTAPQFKDGGDNLMLYKHGGPDDINYELYMAAPIASEIVFVFNLDVGTAASSDPNGETITVGTGTPPATTVTASGLGERDEITFTKSGNGETVKIRVMTVARLKINLVGATDSESVTFTNLSAQNPAHNGTETLNPGDSVNGLVDYNGGNVGSDGDKITIVPNPSGNRIATIKRQINGGSASTVKSVSEYELTQAAVYTFTVTFEDPAVTPPPPPPPPAYDDDDDDDDDDRGSSGGGSGGGGTDSGNTVPVTVTASDATSAAREAVAQAQSSGSGVATVSLRNPDDIALDALKAMTSAAGMPVTLNADTLSPSGNAVEVRIVLDPSKATGGLSLSASTSDSNAKNTSNLFESYFKNDVSTVSFGQQGSFGQSVRVAVKPEPDMKTSNLYFYAYNKATNTFSRISSANYFIDANGYLHFTTTVGGSIIISDGPLSRK